MDVGSPPNLSPARPPPGAARARSATDRRPAGLVRPHGAPSWRGLDAAATQPL